MRNLKLQFCEQVDTKIPDVKFLLTDSTGERQNAKIFLVTTDKVYATNERFELVKELANEADIVGAEYLAITDELCLATDDGRILSVEPSSGAINENSYCDVGLTKMAWSPEQEVVVFITKNNNVVVMTCTYDPISEHALQEQCEKEQQFVNVGWGRKETQFHGSEGKGAAKQKTKFEQPKENADILSDIEISWRYDGAYFAVSFVSTQFGRMFKVFDKEGLLQFTSEKLNGLAAPIAWRPSGTWIAIPHAFPNKSTIALFEKNGLRHREIVLPFSFEQEKVCKLKWSTDSDILVIQTQRENKEHLYLYTIGNYHWYLKQTLSFEEGVKINDFHFGMDSMLERTLHVVLNNGFYLRYRWYFDVDKFERDGLVAVIDGNSVLLTNLSNAIVPPPMSAMQLKIDANINACIFFEDITQERLLLCLYDAVGNFHLHTTKLNEPTKFELVAMFSSNSEHVAAQKNLGQFANVTFCAHDSIIATQCAKRTTSFLLIKFNWFKKFYSINDCLQQPGVFNALHFNYKTKQLFAHNIENNTVYNFDVTHRGITLIKQQRWLPHAATQILTYVNQNKETLVIALCHNQCLYIDDHLITDTVTSFCLEAGVEAQYFAFTKHAELFLLRLSNRSVDAVRSIESGGKLVAICADTSRAVLQMPRGNLEAFYPRLLLLDRVGKMLDGYEYEKVMDLLVKQRINLNIICDHDLISFVENVPKFVDSIENVQWLNLFLSDLRNEDITKTMYANGYNTSPRAYPPEFQIENKIKFICEKMLAYMENVDEPKRQRLILPIITAKVKMADLEAALEIIWKLKKAESTNEKTKSEDALKYLLYLVDVNDLYNVALGTYDFGLVLFVAQKSQKDPREFLPFLNELKELDVKYRQFKIDEHLKRYEKALKNIAECTEAERFEEALDFIVRHQLYTEALRYYENQAENYQRICLAYADHLRAEGKLDNASLMYERGGDTAQALRCAKNCIDWQRVLSLAHLEDTDKVATVALSLVPALQEKRLNAEAFHLLNTYGDSFEDALDCLLKGNLYLKAIYEARLYQAKNKYQPDFIVSKIKPSLEVYVQTFDCVLVEQAQTFSDYKERLFKIREQRERLKDAGGALGAEEMFDECDLLSDTTSMRSSHYTGSSRGTGKTFRSSKNRRKHERKHFSLKPGNPFEDIALIDALYGLILKIVEQQQHVHDTCKALLELRIDDKAMQIQKRFKQLVTLVQNASNEIWTPELAVGIQQMSTAEAANIDYMNFQNEQRYALLEPIKRFKPQIKLGDWEHAILV